MRTFDSMVLLIGFCDKTQKFLSCTSMSLARIHSTRWSSIQPIPLRTSGTQRIAAAGIQLDSSLGLRPELKKTYMHVTFWPMHGREGLAAEELPMHAEFQEYQLGWTPYLRAHWKWWSQNTSARLPSCKNEGKYWEENTQPAHICGRYLITDIRVDAWWLFLAQRHVPAGTRHTVRGQMEEGDVLFKCWNKNKRISTGHI